MAGVDWVWCNAKPFLFYGVFIRNKIRKMELTIDNLKKQLNIELEWLDDDILLQTYLDIATTAVSNYLDLDAEDVAALPENNTINAAIILLAAHFYSNRNMVSMANASEMPYSFKFLLDFYKNITVA